MAKLSTGGIWAVAGALFAGMAAAADLSESGVVLSDVRVVPAAAEVVKSIDLEGDVPVATYVTAAMPDGRRLMRNANGFWVDWDGRQASLVDNGFVPSGGRLTYKVLKEDLSGRLFPIHVTVAYKVGETVKFGVFQVVAQ